VLFVHDLVDDVTLQAITAGQSAAHYVLENGSDDLALAQTQQKRGLVGRPKADEMVCTLCPTGCIMKITITPNDITVENNACEQGRDYAINELHIPKRHLTTTIAIGGDPSKRLPVRTSKPVPKDKIPQVMKEIQTISINTPVTLHQILIYSVADSDSNIISSAELRG
jgi:CxxC motif-containing protein